MENKNVVDRPIFIFSTGFFLLFILSAIININVLSNIMNVVVDFVSNTFGWFYLITVFVIFLLCMFVIFSKLGDVKLGKPEDKIEFSLFRWLAILFCTAIASGSVFYGPAEPLWHYSSPPPALGGSILAGSAQAAEYGVAYSYFHWGVSAWALYVIFALAIGYAHYNKGLPLRVSSAFYPILNEEQRNGWMGKAIDVLSIIAIIAGMTPAPGFLTKQLSFTMSSAFNMIQSQRFEFIILAIVVVMYTWSAYTGVFKGISWLSTFNVYLGWALLLAVFLVGPTAYILKLTVSALGHYIQNFFTMSLWSDPTGTNTGWMNTWTVFYWAWWLGFAPMTGLFLARISKGRTLREICIGGIFATSVGMFSWFSVLGGTGLYLDQTKNGVIVNALNEFGLPAALINILDNISIGNILMPFFLVLITVFLVTSVDSVTLAASMAISGDDEPPKYIRIIWAMIIASCIVILLTIGGGLSGLEALQSITIITALPVCIISLTIAILVPIMVTRDLKVKLKKKTADYSGLEPQQSGS